MFTLCPAGEIALEHLCCAFGSERCCARGVRGHDHVGKRPQRAIDGQWLHGEHVECSGSEAPCGERIDECRFIDELATADIHQVGTRAEQGELGRADHAVGALVERCAQNDVVGDAQQFVKAVGQIGGKDGKSRLRAILTQASLDAEEEFKALKPDLQVMAFVTLFVPEEFLNIPTHGSIQYHPSLLPAYRGPSAINWPIIKGETETGLSIFWPDNGLDTGDVLVQKKTPISDTACSRRLVQCRG